MNMSFGNIHKKQLSWSNDENTAIQSALVPYKSEDPNQNIEHQFGYLKLFGKKSTCGGPYLVLWYSSKTKGGKHPMLGDENRPSVRTYRT